MYHPIIGLEIHVELRTLSKMFCGCPADHFGKPPNTQTCPVCLGLPGALPVPNQKAVDWTILLGLALGSQINPESKFDRKHYFYPDLPKGYQISQYDQPLCLGGQVVLPDRTINLTRIHLEEDTGKLQHATLDHRPVTLVDFNRSGVALVELVSEPEIRSSTEAKAYAKKIQQVVRYLQISDADMEKGSMRLEANISLSQSSKLPSYKVEVKNINSFRFLEKAIDYEISRQTKILNQGQTPKQETRGFNENRGVTLSQRSKEEAADYRYFPEPDIPPMTFTPEKIQSIRDQLPRLPDTFAQIFSDRYHIRADYIATLLTHPQLAAKTLLALEMGVKTGLKAETIVSKIINQKISPQSLDLHALIKSLAPKAQSLTPAQLDQHIHQVLTSNPDIVDKYRQGKTVVIGVLIGLVIKASGGQADPKDVRMHLLKML